MEGYLGSMGSSRLTRLPATVVAAVALASGLTTTAARAAPAVPAQPLTHYARLAEPLLPASPIALEALPRMVRSVYARVHLPRGEAARTGAIGTNARYGTPGVKLAIGPQRAGAPYVAAGILNGRRDQVLAGRRIFDWGWARQTADGGFPDAHRFSVAFFVVAQARSALMLLRSRWAARDRARITALLPRLQAACRWMLRPDVAARARYQESRFNHRDYATGAAFAFTDLLARALGRPAQFQQAEADTLAAGLARQWPNGVNPELHGWDASYQSVGLMFALEWLQVHRDWRAPLAARMLAATDRAMSWLKRRIGPTGILDHRGDTRTSGPRKGPSYISIERALAFWGALTGDARARRKARLVSHWVGSAYDRPGAP